MSGIEPSGIGEVAGDDPLADAAPATLPRIVLVDDHALFRSGVRAELNGRCTIVGEAADVDQAVAVILVTAPDVVLLDVHLPGGGGVAVLEQVLAQRPDQAFLALTVSDAPDDVVATVRAGARGYVQKTIAADELVAAIEQVRAGEPVFSPRLAGFVLRAFSGQAPSGAVDEEVEQLTPREREVLQLIARGYAYKQIAQRLDISPRTVESHTSAVLRKLQLTSRHELSRWAARRGLVD
ncbi:MAG: response regulator transcription factor [Patulibacter sp.]|nr:response regulator transcription factor [Patulibacter sp.]